MNVIRLMEFEDNLKRYVVYLKDNKLSFGYAKDNDISSDLSVNELDRITNIYNLLVGNSNDLIKLSSNKINNSLITFFYNPKNKLYSFYEVKNNKYQLPNPDIITTLNTIYNHQEGKLYQNNNNKKNKYIKILVDDGAKIITVFVLSSLLLSYLPAMPNNKVLFSLDYALDNTLKDSNIVYDNNNYSFNDVKSSIDSNPYLTEEEKEFLYNIEPEISENIKYIDIDQLKKNLEELKINYNVLNNNNHNQKDVLIGFSVTGSYTFMGLNKNNINLYNGVYSNATSLENADKATLIHEVNHVINNRSALLSLEGLKGDILGASYGVFDVETNVLNEMNNELFSREYGIYYDKDLTFNGYNYLMPAMYALAEIIDEDTLRRYKFNSDDYYINSYLISIGVSNSYTYTLYKDLNLLRYSVLTSEDKDKVAKEVYDIIKYMYEKKYNINMEDDLVMQAYFYNSIFTDDEFDYNFEQNVGVSDIMNIQPKGYFATDYITNNPNVIVQQYNDSETNLYKNSFIITNDNRYIKNIVK